jgi:hypothetical protein
MRRFVMMVAAAAAVGSVVMTVRPSEAQAPNEMVRQYGYQFCAILATDNNSVRDCGYTTLQQCQATASGMGYCLENSAYIAARANAANSQAAVPPRNARKRRP